ncbi:MAG: aldehyde ferredoxin oxidoreductase family protein [Candidatus Njordarchaeales archaeon]
MVDAYLRRVLYIDLTHKRYWVEDREDLFEKWLGGVGVAVQLLKEELPKDADPLGPDNVIVLAVGPLVGYYPLASKTVAVFKSPLTGNYGESHAGGRSAVALRMCGFGAIVIKGASDIPIYLAIHNGKVYFRDAGAYWGMRSTYTVGRIIRENEPGAGLRTIIRIGLAGENLVRYACATTETYRHFGRLGLGAVMGSKKLKAIVISGKRLLPVKDKKLYREIYQEIYDKAVKSPLMKKYHDYGTPVNVKVLNEIKALPTMNLKKSFFEYADYLSGEFLAENYLGRRVACTHCPVACVHIATWREPYEDEPFFYKTKFVSYDYEPIYALGTMLGIKDTVGFLRLLEAVEIYGLDAMSTGACLAWATEALERGIISEKDTIVKLSWGDWKSYIKAVEYIVNQPNEFYKALAMGVEYASTKYGGKDFALAFGGLEMPGYHTGPAAHIGYLLGSRHSHLDMAGYSLDQKTLGQELTPEETVDRLMKEETWRQILSSLVICFFARGIYSPEVVSKALKPLGYDLSEEDLKKLGEEIYKEKYRLKIREGFDPRKLRIPRRILETESAKGKLSEEYIQKAISYFVQKIGLAKQ